MFGKIILGLALGVLSLTVVNCTSPLSPNSLSPNSGSISFIVAVDTGEVSGAPARTIKPQDLATGEAILTRDAITSTVPLSIVGGYASASVPNIEAGAWSLQVNFYNANGQLSYTGTKAVTITAGRTLNTSITISATTGAVSINIELPDSQLVLWNTLGSQFDLDNSQVGPALTAIGPGYNFSVAKFGNGLDLNLDGFLNVPCTIFPRSEGTIEFWLKANYSTGPGKRHDLIYTSGPEHAAIRAYSDGNNFYLKIFLNEAIFPQDQIKIVGGKWTHLAFSWDEGAFDVSGETARIYLDGVKVAATTMFIHSGMRDPSATLNLLLRGQTDSGDWVGAMMDNLKVYHKAKTSFSDRNVE